MSQIDLEEASDYEEMIKANEEDISRMNLESEFYDEIDKNLINDLKELGNNIFDDDIYYENVKKMYENKKRIYKGIKSRLYNSNKDDNYKNETKSKFKSYINSRINDYLRDYKRKRTLIKDKQWKKIKKVPLNRRDFYIKYGKKIFFNLKPRLWKPTDYADFYDRSNSKDVESTINYNNNLYNAYLNFDLGFIKKNNLDLYNDLTN